ncbi:MULTISPECIES: MlaD family protein [Rhodomicrobium]|uniref:MlaD family protein n=1 Tax=Rhodomicrobium TaxID=1068 RepID=UPI000B4B5078|nr:MULTISPECIES: MlaD family protein [Rhodomicrobium]
METKANHLIVGGFVILMLSAVFGFVYWIDNYVNGGNARRYDVIFSGSVQGLVEASAVTFNGLRVGTVTSLGILPEDTRKVKVVIALAEGTPVREDTRAQVLQQGLAGWVGLSLSPGSPNAPMLTAKPGEAYPVIYADDTGSGSIMGGVPEAIGNANALFVRLNDLIAANEKMITSTTKNVEAFTAMLDSNKDEVAAVITNARKLSERFDGLAVKLNGAVDQFTGSLAGGPDSFVTQAQQAAQSFRKLAEKLDKTLGDQADGLTGQAKRSMKEFELFMRDGRRLAENLDRVLQKVEANPSTLIFGGSQVPEYKPGQQ